MTSEQFIVAIREVAERAAVRGVLNLLEAPPGRKPDSTLVALSRWFGALDDHDREQVKQILMMGADQTLYNY
jgi:hypothetical protein